MLARTLGRSYRELLETVDGWELALWEADYDLCPWGPDRDDVRALFVARATLAPWQKGGGKLDHKLYFRHLFRRVPDQTPEEMMEIAKSWTRHYGGEVH